jgi:hypothetical protein
VWRRFNASDRRGAMSSARYNYALTLVCQISMIRATHPGVEGLAAARDRASRDSAMGRRKFRQKTGWQTVRHTWVLLSSIVETAVEYGYLQMNQARGVKLPAGMVFDEQV